MIEHADIDFKNLLPPFLKCNPMKPFVIIELISKNNPALVQSRFANWRKRRVQSVDILWDSVDGNVGHVKYRLRATYEGKSYDSVVRMQMFREDGQWKAGGW